MACGHKYGGYRVNHWGVRVSLPEPLGALVW